MAAWIGFPPACHSAPRRNGIDPSASLNLLLVRLLIAAERLGGQPSPVAVSFPCDYLARVSDPQSLAPSQEPAYLAGLNPPQREAVLTTEGPVLVLAGAGTGKTAALTARLAHLIATRRAWPSQILAVTFTNKAAREMKGRVSTITGGAVEGMPWLGTFHSVAARMLRSHAELVGLQSNFTILDTDDQLRLMKQLITASNLDEKRWPARQLAGSDRPVEEPRLDPGPYRRRRKRGFRQRPRQGALRRLPGPPPCFERLRFRRPAAAHADHLQGAPRRPRKLPRALPLYPGRRISGHQRIAI